MADSDKNIVITPQTGVSGTSTTPKITFTGQNNTDIDLFINSSGDLVFQGTTGNLFTVTDNVDGTLFQVNDVSGITLADIVDTGLIRLGLNVEGTQVIIGATAVDTTTAGGTATDVLQVTGNTFTNGTLVLAGIPTYADNTAASSLPDGAVYKTSTGELRIKV